MDLAELAGALRAASRDALARLPDEPWLHVKRVLAEHAEEDELAATAIEALLGIPPVTGGEPHPPARLAAEAHALIATTEDTGRLGLLIGIAAAQERHADELPREKNVSKTFLSRDPFVVRRENAPPDPIDNAVCEAEVSARRGDAKGAADAMRKAAELDAERTRSGDPWGVRPIPPAG